MIINEQPKEEPNREFDIQEKFRRRTLHSGGRALGRTRVAQVISSGCSATLSRNKEHKYDGGTSEEVETETSIFRVAR